MRVGDLETFIGRNQFAEVLGMDSSPIFQQQEGNKYSGLFGMKKKEGPVQPNSEKINSGIVENIFGMTIKEQIRENMGHNPKRVTGLKFDTELQNKILWANKDAFMSGIFDKDGIWAHLPPVSIGQIPKMKPIPIRAEHAEPDLSDNLIRKSDTNIIGF